MVIYDSGVFRMFTWIAIVGAYMDFQWKLWYHDFYMWLMTSQMNKEYHSRVLSGDTFYGTGWGLHIYQMSPTNIRYLI